MMKRIWAQFWNRWVMPVTWVCLDSATTQNSWRTSAQRTYLVFTFGQCLNFDLALYASRMSICALRTSLCGANAMCCWFMWVSASYCKLRRNRYCCRRISLISTSPDFVSWANFEGISQLHDASDGQAKIVLGQCWYEDFKKQKIGTSTSTSTTVNCSQRPKVGNLGLGGVNRPGATHDRPLLQKVADLREGVKGFPKSEHARGKSA